MSESKYPVLLVQLLKLVFEEIFVTSDVLEEFSFGVKRGVLPEVELLFEVLNLNESEFELYESLRRKLGKGEASSLVIAKNRGMKLLTDDLDARKTANILGIPVLNDRCLNALY
ncbi:MAG: hypothetical protein ACOC5L_03250 [Halobacteriota archaeon]